MAKIDKDQFEELIERNAPTEEPSAAVFVKLQKEAVWNQPQPTAHRSPAAGIIILLTAGLVLLAIWFLPTQMPESHGPASLRQETPEPAPEIGPTDVIAAGELPIDTGFYRFMKYKSDDFNLSFHDETAEMSLLAGEIDRI